MTYIPRPNSPLASTPGSGPTVHTNAKTNPYREYEESGAYAQTVRWMIDDLTYLGQTLFPHFFKAESAPIHRHFAEVATDLSITFPVIETFRESAKSTYFATFLPVWHMYCEPFIRADIYPKTRRECIAFLAKYEKRYIVVLSKSSELAKQRLRTLKRVHGALHADEDGVLTGRKRLIDHFGKPSYGRNDATELHLNRGVIKSLGGGQQGHGLQEESVRITLGVVDDPETEENTKTETATRNNYRTIMNGIHRGLAPHGRMPVLATPIRPHSFVRRCKKLADAESVLREEGAADLPGWYYFRHPLIEGIGDNIGKDGITPTRIPTYDAYTTQTTKSVRSAWEDRWPIKQAIRELDTKRTAGAAADFFQAKQCELRADEETRKFREADIMLYDGVYFKEGGEWFLRLTHVGAYTEPNAPFLLDTPEVIPVNLFTGHDHSFGVRRDNAVKLTRAYDGKRHFIHSITRSNTAGPEVQVEWLLVGSAEHGTLGYKDLQEKAIIVEATFMKNAMERAVQEREDELDMYLPVIASPPRTSKSEKYVASSIFRDFARKQVYFKREHEPSIHVFINYDVSLDNQVDDDPDAYELSRQRNYAPYHSTESVAPTPEPTHTERLTHRQLNSWRLPRQYSY